MHIFDIIGPVMIGPSSSHTAGAVRIGYVSRIMLDDEPKSVEITLCGSFAATGKGHGTDTALIAGLLGMRASDVRVPNSFALARSQGLEFRFSEAPQKGAHPNTAILDLKGKSGRQIKIQASSIGGGRIMVNYIDDIEVNFSGEMNTLIVHNMDKPGNVANITGLLHKYHINIAAMQLYRHEKGGFAVMILEVDQDVPVEIIDEARQMKDIIKVSYLKAVM